MPNSNATGIKANQFAISYKNLFDQFDYSCMYLGNPTQV